MNSRLKFQILARRFSVGMVIAAPSSSVWKVITDTSVWPEWGPSVVDVSCRNRFVLYGSKGVIQTVMGFSVSFAITSLKKEREWTWSVGGINATGHRIVPIHDNSCILFFDMPIWAFPYSIICIVALHRIKKIVASIKNKNSPLAGFTD